MKKILVLLIGLSAACSLSAQDDKKKQQTDFDNFLQEANKSFDDFIDQANKEFIEFMRSPWTQLDAEQPVEQRKKPEPEEPTVYDPSQAAVDPLAGTPVCLDIEDILDLSTEEGKQRPTTKVNDLDDILFNDLPDDPTAQPRRRPVVVVEEEEETVIIKRKPTQPNVPSGTPSANPSTNPSAGQTPAGGNVSDPSAATQPSGQPADQPAGNPSAAGAGGTNLAGGTAGTAGGATGGTSAGAAGGATAAALSGAAAMGLSIDASLPVYAGGNSRTAFVYAGNTYYLSNQLKGQCTLAGTSENNVADAYEKLARSNYSPLVSDLKELRSSGITNDWMTFVLVQQVATKFCSTTNAAAVMRYFLLSELGYKTRLVRKSTNNDLALMVGVNCQLYGRIYIEQDGVRYYDVESKSPYSFYTCQTDAPKAKSIISMDVARPIYTGGDSKTNTHQAKGSAAAVSAPVPTQLMNVYASYPQCDYRVYATAAVNPTVATAILTPLAEQIKGKSEADAANLLINFVQTGFAYATDGQQFGYEKPFFVEELFYYPYCDCEDRSVLFGYLIKNLLGLDVVYLDYPDHIATAVHFTTDPGGDYFNIDGKKYTVCDPTYIGASIGMSMPQYKTASATILKY